MASQGNWLTDGWNRLTNGADPITAFFTPAPQASAAMGKNSYYAPSADPNPPAAITGPVQQPAAPPTGPYSGATASAYDANLDPALVAQARGQVNPLIAQLHQLYGDLNSQIDMYGRDKRSQLDENLNTGLTNNTNSFNKAYNSTAGIYTARGAGDSSYLGNAQQGNKNDLSASNTNLTNTYNTNLEGLSSILGQNKAVVANEPKIDLSQYGDVNSLMTLRNSLDNHIANLNSTKTNLLTSGQLKSQLDTIAPGKSTLDASLKDRIDKLGGSGATPDAIYGLGQGYINSAGLSGPDKDKWTTYLRTVMGK